MNQEYKMELTITRPGYPQGISTSIIHGTWEQCLEWLDKQPDLTRQSMEWSKKNGYES